MTRTRRRWKHRLTDDDRAVATRYLRRLRDQTPEGRLGGWEAYYRKKWGIKEHRRVRLDGHDRIVLEALKSLPGDPPREFLTAWKSLKDKERAFIAGMGPAVREKLRESGYHWSTKKVQDSLRRIYRFKMLKLEARSQQLVVLLDKYFLQHPRPPPTYPFPPGKRRGRVYK